jgi:hypothetical protein
VQAVKMAKGSKISYLRSNNLAEMDIRIVAFSMFLSPRPTCLSAKATPPPVAAKTPSPPSCDCLAASD